MISGTDEMNRTKNMKKVIIVTIDQVGHRQQDVKMSL